MISLLQQILGTPSIARHPHEPESVDDEFSGVMMQAETNSEVEEFLIEPPFPVAISGPQPWLNHRDTVVLQPMDAIPEGSLVASMPSPIADQSNPSIAQPQLITPLGPQVTTGPLKPHPEPSDVLLTKRIERSPDNSPFSGDLPDQTGSKPAPEQGAMARQSHPAFVRQVTPDHLEIPTATQSLGRPAELGKLARPKPATKPSALVPQPSETAVGQTVAVVPTQTPRTIGQSQNAFFARIEAHDGHTVVSQYTVEPIQQTAPKEAALNGPTPSKDQMPTPIGSPRLTNDQLSPKPEGSRAAPEHSGVSSPELRRLKDVNATALKPDRIDLDHLLSPDVPDLVVPTEKQLSGPTPTLTSVQSTSASPTGMPLPTTVPTALIAQVQVAATGPLELVLDPEELGKVRFQIHHQGEQLRVVLVVERPETLDMLRRNVDQLVQEFRNAGFASASFSFSQSGGQQGGASQHLITEAASDFDAPDSPSQTDRFPSAYPNTSPSRGLSLRL